MERVWEGLAAIRYEFKVPGLSVRPSIHANRSLTYGGDGVMSKRFWGGDEFCDQVQAAAENSGASGDEWVPTLACGVCPGCQSGVGAEALDLGYLDTW
jgi:hypothetical protein